MMIDYAIEKLRQMTQKDSYRFDIYLRIHVLEVHDSFGV